MILTQTGWLFIYAGALIKIIERHTLLNLSKNIICQDFFKLMYFVK